jgi:hypothetical protein
LIVTMRLIVFTGLMVGHLAEGSRDRSKRYPGWDADQVTGSIHRKQFYRFRWAGLDCHG